MINLKSFGIATAALSAVSILTFAGEAGAVGISGGISFTGGYKPVDSAWTQTTLDVATGIDFTPNAMRAADCNGDFATYVFCDPLFGHLGTITDFQFDPFTPTIASFWSIGGFDFELANISVDQQTSSNLTISGTGTITGNSFDPTSGTWVFTANHQGGTFSWSSSTAASATVPEPATLLGLGLVGAAIAGTRRKNTKA